MSKTFKATVTFEVEYTMCDEEFAEQALAAVDLCLPASKNAIGRRGLATLLDGWDLVGTPFIGIPGSSLEAVTVIEAKNVRGVNLIHETS